MYVRSDSVLGDAQWDGGSSLFFYDFTSGKFMTLHKIVAIYEI